MQRRGMHRAKPRCKRVRSCLEMRGAYLHVFFGGEASENTNVDGKEPAEEEWLKREG
jgi:hypothetical protein